MNQEPPSHDSIIAQTRNRSLYQQRVLGVNKSYVDVESDDSSDYDKDERLVLEVPEVTSPELVQIGDETKKTGSDIGMEFDSNDTFIGPAERADCDPESTGHVSIRKLAKSKTTNWFSEPLLYEGPNGYHTLLIVRTFRVIYRL